MVNDVLPKVKEENLAEFADIFCEKNVFTVEQSRKFLRAAKNNNLKLKIHADEMYQLGGTELAVELGKQANPNIELGICGEHAGDPASIEFCNKIGLHYVSCSPYRVPTARLAAAQAAIKAKKN